MRDRQEHERQLKQEELEDQRKSRLREERIQAYVALFALARGARAASHRDQRPVAQPGGRALLEDLREARASVELLRETQQLDKHAEALYDQCKEFLEREQWDEADKKEADKEYRRAREDFLEWARHELGLRSRPPDS